MQFDDEGILVSKIKYGETSMILGILTKNHGMQKGILKGATSLKNKSFLEVGNILSVNKKYKNEDALGFLKIELKESYLGNIFTDKQRILALSSICSLCYNLLTEKEINREFFEITKSLIILLEDKNYLTHYLKWEVILLNKIGYGLDLDKCVQTNSKDIYYLSPKTGKAVTKEVGYLYKDKLFIIPDLLKDQKVKRNYSEKELTDNLILGFKITSFFLNNFMKEYNRQMPFVRNFLVQNIYR